MMEFKPFVKAITITRIQNYNYRYLLVALMIYSKRLQEL